MNKKEEFKQFASLRPELSKMVRNGETTWQKLYETYDIYGSNNEVWNKTPKEKTTLTNFMKNIDINSIQGHINNAQKALSVLGEFTSSGSKNLNNITKGPDAPRPINKFFGD